MSGKVKLQKTRNQIVLSLIFTRGLVMGSNFITSLAIAYLCFSKNSPGIFGYYSFIASLAFFLPVLDLGIGQSVYNHFSRKTVDNFSARDFAFFLKLLRGISITWVSFIVLLYSLYQVISPRAANPIELSSHSGMFAISLVLYSLSIPFSAGFKLLNSIPKTELSLMLQSTTSPLILVFFTFGKIIHTELQILIFIAPPLSFLITNMIAYFVAKKYLKFDLSISSTELTHKTFNLFVFGSWSTLLTLASLLITFLPRIILESKNELMMLDRYSYFLTILTPFLSLISLYAMRVNPDFRKIREEHQFHWLVSHVKVSVALGLILSIVLLILSAILHQLKFPSLGIIETIFAVIILLLYAIFFVPLSAQSNLEDIKRFSALNFIVIIFQVALAVLIPNQSYLVFLLTTVLVSYAIQCFGITFLTLFVLKDKVLKKPR